VPQRHGRLEGILLGSIQGIQVKHLLSVLLSANKITR